MSNLDQSPIMQLAAQGQADELLEVLRNKCLEPMGGLYYFTKVVLGYKDLVPHFHLPFCDHIVSSIPLLKRGYLLPRGHFKSTVISKAYLLWRFCGGARVSGKDPRNLRWLVVGESDTVAKKNINDIAWHLQNNQLLKVLFPEIIPPDFSRVKWTDTELEINRPQSFDEPSIKTVGIGAKLTGFHFSGIDYDDPIGEKAAKSVAEMQSAEDWFAYAPGLADDPLSLEEIIAGTRWKHGKADLYGKIMDELPEGQQTDGRPCGFTWYVKGCYDEDGDPLFWPRFTREVLQSILQREKTYKFSAQYLNQPCAPEGSQFREEQIKTFKIAIGADGKRDLILPTDGTPAIKLAHLARLSFYDPSSGGKFAGSENAIVLCGTSPDGRKFAFKVWSANCGFREAVEQWFRFNDQYLTWPNLFEGVGPHKEVASIVALRQVEDVCRVCILKDKKVKHRRLGPVCVNPPGGVGSKEDRILTFIQADVEDGLVYLHEDDILTRKQMLEFPHGELMDRLDALAYAVYYSRRPHTVEELEAQEHEREAKNISRVQRTAQTYDVGGYV
jgi:hypothetical protein